MEGVDTYGRCPGIEGEIIGLVGSNLDRMGVSRHMGEIVPELNASCQWEKVRVESGTRHHPFLLFSRVHFRLSSKQVADPDLGENIARMRGISFDFAAQAVDVDLQHVALPGVF